MLISVILWIYLSEYVIVLIYARVETIYIGIYITYIRILASVVVSSLQTVHQQPPETPYDNNILEIVYRYRTPLLYLCM